MWVEYSKKLKIDLDGRFQGLLALPMLTSLILQDQIILDDWKNSTMIITRSPLRVSLGGGGTDLPSYYEQHGGYVIAGAIDKYVYVTVTRPFKKGIFLKYSELEEAIIVDEVRHPIIREVLSSFQSDKSLLYQSRCIMGRFLQLFLF